MLDLQRIVQSLWLVIALVPLYSNFVHRATGRLAIELCLWSAVAAGTVWLIRRPLLGLRVSIASAVLVLLVVGSWATKELLQGLPHGPRGEGNPLVIFEALFYFVVAVLPAAIVLILSWFSNRMVRPRQHSFESQARDGRARGSSPAGLASLSSRLGAQLVDAAIAFAAFLVAVPLAKLNDSLVLAGLILFLLYYLLADALPNGQSIGKRLLKISVVDDRTGAPCTLLKSALRNVTQLLGIFDWLCIFGDQRKRAGDYLARTRVIVAQP